MSIYYIKAKRGVSDSEEQYLFLEDYLCDPNISEARKITDKIFSENRAFIEYYNYDFAV